MSQHIPLEDLSAHLDGALTEARAAQVSLHLTDCPACRESQAELAWARAYLRATPPEPLPAGLDFRLPEDEADASPQAEDEAPGNLVAFPARGTWWGLASVAAILLLAFLLRPLARGLGLGAVDQAAAPAAEISLESALSADAPAAPPAASPDLEAMVGAAGTQAVDDSRGPTTLAPLATARRADQARLIQGRPTADAPDATPLPPAAVAAGGEAGGYVPPESPLGSLERADIAQLQDRSLAGPRATATALGLALAELAPQLTSPPEGSAPQSREEAAATWTAGQAQAQELAAILGQQAVAGAAASAKLAGGAPADGEPGAGSGTAAAALREAAAGGDPTAQAALKAGLESAAEATASGEALVGASGNAADASGSEASAGTAGSSAAAGSDASAGTDGSAGSDGSAESTVDPMARAWIPGLALMVALLALGLMAAGRARRRRRRS